MFKRILPFILAFMVLAPACTESKTSTEEKTEINTMDSVSKKIEVSVDKLKEQTRKVEESLEKLDKEFETNN